MTIFGRDVAVALVDDAFIFTTKTQEYPLAKIHATGSALKIPGLAQLISDQLGHPLTEFASDVHPSIEGAKIVLKELNYLTRSAPSKNKRPAL